MRDMKDCAILIRVCCALFNFVHYRNMTLSHELTEPEESDSEEVVGTYASGKKRLVPTKEKILMKYYM